MSNDTPRPFRPSAAPGSAGGPEPLTAFFTYDFDERSRRLHVRYKGFWSIAVAEEVNSALRSAFERAAAKRQPFTLLDDCGDWGPQSQEVSEIAKSYADICRDFSISRNAMIIPQALLRLQVRRTLAGYPCEIFDTFEAADRWLAEVEPGRRE